MANEYRHESGPVAAFLATASAGRDDLLYQTKAPRRRREAAGARRAGRPDPPNFGSHSAANDRDNHHCGCSPVAAPTGSGAVGGRMAVEDRRRSPRVPIARRALIVRNAPPAVKPRSTALLNQIGDCPGLQRRIAVGLMESSRDRSPGRVGRERVLRRDGHQQPSASTGIVDIGRTPTGRTRRQTKTSTGRSRHQPIASHIAVRVGERMVPAPFTGRCL